MAVVAFRLLAVARGDPEIAYAILQTGGTGTVLTATLVSTLGLLALPFFVIFGINGTNASRELRKANLGPLGSINTQLLLTGSLVMLTIALYMSPVLGLLLGIGAALPALLVWGPIRTLTSGKSFLFLYVSIYFFALLGYSLLSPTPWLPVQAIYLAGQKPFSGYVLSQANGEYSILTSKPEGLINVPSQSILRTEQCTPPLYELEQATLLDLFEQAGRKLIIYMACPSTSYSQSSQVRPIPSLQSPSPSPSSSPSPSGRA